MFGFFFSFYIFMLQFAPLCIISFHHFFLITTLFLCLSFLLTAYWVPLWRHNAFLIGWRVLGHCDDNRRRRPSVQWQSMAPSRGHTSGTIRHYSNGRPMDRYKNQMMGKSLIPDRSESGLSFIRLHKTYICFVFSKVAFNIVCIFAYYH